MKKAGGPYERRMLHKVQMGWIGEALSDSTNVFEELGHVIKFARVRENLLNENIREKVHIQII